MHNGNMFDHWAKDKPAVIPPGTYNTLSMRSTRERIAERQRMREEEKKREQARQSEIRHFAQWIKKLLRRWRFSLWDF